MSKMKIKEMSVKEFRQVGYLQELNRNFLHPLGLALEVLIEEDGTEKIGRIWDYRDDPTGLNYGLSESDDERISSFTVKANNIESISSDRKKAKKRSNSGRRSFEWIEPIPEISEAYDEEER